MADITCILPNLQGGGAERVAVNLANDWAGRGHAIQFALMEQRGQFLSALSHGISVHSLQALRFRQVPQRLIAYLRERQPDITLAHMWPLTSVAALAWRMAGSPGRLVLCEHTSLTNHVRRDLSTPLPVVKASLRFSHRLASELVAVSYGAAADLARLTGVSERAIRVIHNPVVPAQLQSRQPPDYAERKRLWQGVFSCTIISVGILKSSKNLLQLLDAFSELAEELDAGLVILGEGAQRSVLEKRIVELGLQQRVRMPGFVVNTDPWLRAADLFVLSSEYEGFGNVVVEALAAGTPVVSTACPYGPDEILEQGRHGVLVPVGERAALAQGIRSALGHSWDAAALQRRALDFSIPRQASAYLELFGVTSP
jgi:glycosyltransferase involved in cell wall biosynthesis